MISQGVIYIVRGHMTFTFQAESLFSILSCSLMALDPARQLTIPLGRQIVNQAAKSTYRFALINLAMVHLLINQSSDQ